ncbi:transglutaminase-like domain-containing protein [Microvirga soli]|uniref:transglutaminase-like domain-containing protein n=1 Tax=Microvirga soli TaxID=1854496 RepID=UPI00191F885C|nr:transglutaminase-like domain-containing protein [Microvirga soli]
MTVSAMRRHIGLARNAKLSYCVRCNLLLTSLVPVGLVFGMSLLVTSALASSSGRRVALTAIVSINNLSEQPVSPYYFQLTIPVADHPQQRLVSLDYAAGETPDRKQHKNGTDEYLEFKWTIPAHSTVRREVTFVLELTPYEEDAIVARPLQRTSDARFLRATPLVESDAPEVRTIANQLMARHALPQDRARAAYEYARTELKVRKEAENRGALYALQTGGGDCTEYAAVFSALSRAMGIPARMTAEFLFGDDESRFSQPNHHSAEVFLDGRWLPVDPNLAVDPSFGYGYGFGGARKVVLRREGAWVWSSWPKVHGANIKIQVDWSVRSLTTKAR